MSSKQFVEWVHGEKEVRTGSLPRPQQPGKPVTEVEVFEDLIEPGVKEVQQRRAKDIYTVNDLRFSQEPSPSEPED